MRYILIPVKELTRAKQRLAALMTQDERTRFAWLMLESTFATVARVKGIDRMAVVTLYPPAVELARRYGMEVILEAEQVSESASVDFGARELQKRGAEAVLRLTIDLPLLTHEDVEEVIAHDLTGPSVVIVPSRDGTGTNAILRRPPVVFPSHFGENSLAKHLAEAEERRLQSKVVHLPRIALDIDSPEDVAMLMSLGTGTEVQHYLEHLKIEERLVKYFSSEDELSAHPKPFA